jgi:hypothetical protein
MKPFGRVKVGAKHYHVKLVPTDAKELEGARGLTNIETGVVYLDETLQPLDLLDTFIHELTHAVWSESGLAVMLFGHIEEEEVRELAEEHAIVALTPHVVGMLTELRRPAWAKRLGKLFPKNKGKS